MILQHGSAQYRVGDLVAKTATYNVYLCEEVATGRQCLLQIATTTAHNGGLTRAAYVLKQLKQKSDEFEAEHAKDHPGRKLSYDRLFPIVVDSFVDQDQGRRRINILAITEVDDVTLMVPLSNFAKAGWRVSLPSSAWVMGRLLKLLGLAHSQRFTVRTLGGNNILLESSRHFVVVFDWSAVQSYPGKIPGTNRRRDIASAARSVFIAIGGDPETGLYPYDAGSDQQYIEYLVRLMAGRDSDAYETHRQFYELVGNLWGQEFREFETLPL